MKKIFVLLILQLLFVPLFAQQLSVGLESGIISSTLINPSNSENYSDFRNSYNYGINFNYHLSNKYTLSTGLHYLRQGKKQVDSSRETFPQNYYSNDYLSVPISAVYKLGKRNKILTMLGVYGAFRLKAQDEGNAPVYICGCGCGLCGVSGTSYANSVPLNEFYLGGAAGLGYNFLDTKSLSLNSMFKYYHSVTPIDDYDRSHASFLFNVELVYKIPSGPKK